MCSGVFVDPTEDCDADTYEEVLPADDAPSKYSPRGKSSLLLMDACQMLKVQLSGCLRLPEIAKVMVRSCMRQFNLSHHLFVACCYLCTLMF